MEERSILDIAMEYGSIKFKLGQLSILKNTIGDEETEKEYEEANRKRNELLDELWDAYHVI